jgi:lysophospholipase L1-like esterase
MKVAVRSVTFLLLLAIVFLVPSCSVPKEYAQEAKKWEKDILKFEELDKTEQYSNDAILFVGSSSIRLWSTMKEDMAPYHVINRGFGGSKFSDIACYVNRIVYPHQFQALVFYAGNDIIGSTADKTPKEVAHLFKYIVKEVRVKNPGQPIFLIEITPAQKTWKGQPGIKEANALLAKICEKLPDVYFIPTSSYYLTKEGKPKTELFRNDMLHQNREGYLIWSKLIKARLDEVLKKKV